MKIQFSINKKIEKAEILEKIKLTLFDCMVKMHELAVINCPVDSSALVNSIKLFPSVPGATTYELADGVTYGIDVEFGCFFKDSILIKTKKGNKKLKDLKFNDDIWTGECYKKLIQKEKLEIGYPLRKITIKTKNRKIEVTEDHPIMTNKGLKKARDLKKGDKIKILKW